MPAKAPLPDPLGREPFSYGEGRAAGLTPGRLRGHSLGHPFHGSRHPDPQAQDVVSLCRAYMPVMRADAFFCSITAAVIMRVPLPAAMQRVRQLHVAVPHPVRAPEGRGIVGHAVKLMGDDSRRWEGLRVSSPERLWCELSAVLSMSQLVAAGDYLIHREHPISSVGLLVEAAERYPRAAGAALRRRCLPHLDSGAESPPESELRVLVSLAGLKGFVANRWVQVPGARYRGDLVCAERRMIIEYQSAYHFDPAQRRKDMTRIERLRAAGWFVMEVNADDLGDPHELVARIRRVYESRPVC